MDQKTVLKFGAGAQTLTFIFASGKESDIYESKEAALHEMADMVIRKKIKAEEVGALTEEIMNSSLPRKEKGSVHTLHIAFAVASASAGSDVMQRAQSLFKDITPDQGDQALVRMCSCGGKHAFMFFQNSKERAYAGKLLSKKECYSALNQAKEATSVSQDMEDRLRAQIEKLPLPETFNGEAEKEKTGAEHAKA